ncbi:MAG: FKBP-type peptidyl-prolyl cis-trans isomerase [Acidimicrobiia bacterium]
MRRRITVVVLVAGLVALAGAGCGDDEGGGEASKPRVEVPDGAPPSELQIEDIKKGTGAEAVAGKTLSVHYVGVSWSDKKQFDASWDTPGGPQPFPFKLGTGAVIQGWDQGLVGMKVGGRRQLIIPPGMAYKEFGQGPIKPNETLVFVVDLLGVT